MRVRRFSPPVAGAATLSRRRLVRIRAGYALLPPPAERDSGAPGVFAEFSCR